MWIAENRTREVVSYVPRVGNALRKGTVGRYVLNRRPSVSSKLQRGPEAMIAISSSVRYTHQGGGQKGVDGTLVIARGNGDGDPCLDMHIA